MFLLTILFLGLFYDTFFVNHDPSAQTIINTPLKNLKVPLVLEIFGSNNKLWRKPGKNKMIKRTETLSEVVIDLKKAETFNFRFVSESQDPLYTFGASNDYNIISLEEITPINNGPNVKPLNFKVEKPGKYQFRIQILSAEKFIVLILKV